MELNLLHVHSESIGYGRLGVKLDEYLRRAGVDVYDDLPGPKDGMAHLQAVAGSQPSLYSPDLPRSKRCNVVAWVSVPSHARGWWKGQIPTLFSMWEAMTLPESFRENLHEFDTVIVPSMQNVELFSKYHKNVKYVPLGIDSTEWAYKPRSEPGAFFRFLIGGSGGRKGVDLAYDAFMATFPDGSWGDGPIPTLVMKSPRGLNGLLNRKGDPLTDVSERVQIISGRIDAEDEVALYADCHAYIQPSRGEGFGLQPLQAIAQGMPTILTDAHGHAAFARLALPISASLAPSGYFIYGDAGEWWEPNFDELCDQMRWVYNNYTEAQRRANVASWQVHERFTWDRVAEDFLDAIGRDRLIAYEGPEEWYGPTPKLYPVTLLRDHYCEIGGVSRIFKAGEVTYEPADVKRIMWEGQLLDPICAQGSAEDTGLLPAQLASLGAYEARNAYCPTCHQQLGTRPNQLDVLMAEPHGPPNLAVVH